MKWLRKLLGIHVHEWTGTVSYTIAPQYRPAEELLPAQQLVGRTIHWRYCACGYSEEFYPK